MNEYTNFFKKYSDKINQAFENLDDKFAEKFQINALHFKGSNFFFAKTLKPLEKGIKSKKWENYISLHHDLGNEFARLNIDFAKYFLMFLEYKHVIDKILRQNGEYSDEERVRIIQGMELVSDTTTAIVSESYIEFKELVIEKQEQALEELLIPILTIRKEVLLVPIIGVVDSKRAMTMTERILNSIKNLEARVIVIDVTGMPIVDTSVANHFVQTATAARFMGAIVIITGISPELSLTMAKLGISLSSIIICSDLQEGIFEGEKLLGLSPVTNGAS